MVATVLFIVAVAVAVAAAAAVVLLTETFLVVGDPVLFMLEILRSSKMRRTTTMARTTDFIFSRACELRELAKTFVWLEGCKGKLCWASRKH